MPAYEWSRDHNAWVKRCSIETCKIGLYVGTVDEAISREFFSRHFLPIKHDSYGAADGLFCQCRGCTSLARRKMYEKPFGRIADPEVLLKLQNGKCGICERTLQATGPGFDRVGRGAIDHDHVTGKIRGILCQSCNIKLGRLEGKFDDDWLLSAMVYLNKRRP